MNNKIENPKTEVPTGLKMNDKDYITSLLTSLKDLEKNYAVALTEASNEDLYKEYFNMFNAISNLQREVYELMFRKGWYCMEVADSNKVSSKLQTIIQEYNDLNIGSN